MVLVRLHNFGYVGTGIGAVIAIAAIVESLQESKRSQLLHAND